MTTEEASKIAGRLAAALLAVGVREETGPNSVVSLSVVLATELQAIADAAIEAKTTTNRDKFLMYVRQEREYQMGVYGPPHDESHSGLEWAGLISKYLGRFATEASHGDSGLFQVLESELVKVAAVALAAYEALTGEK